MDRLAERLKNLSPMQRAVVALKETQARLEALERKQAEPIAVVGMACRFPGGVVDPQSYWQLLCAGVDAIRETPPTLSTGCPRWDVERFYDPDPAVPGKMCTRCGGYLDEIDAFDNHFFGLSDREALRIDPQQRLLLELSWEALEDAGLPPSSLRGTKTGAFVGISNSEYGTMLASDVAQTDAYAATGTSLCLAANRLSFVLGLQGPSLALDTACSSALVAVHLACQNIRNGECEMALAGGTNLLLSPLGTINLTKAGFCAPDGRVRAFDAAASGYVRSEGAGIVVLKPLTAALKDRDPIYAVIRGSAVNQNGSSNGLTAPSRAGQEQVLREAYARAKVSPGQIQFVETQGTGTRLGDTIEAMALGSVLREGRAAGSRCAIGSVKTNIGHMETASGVASLMKAALALKYRQLPPNLHFHTPNPDIPFEQLPLRVVQELEPWPDGGQPRLAGVSAFGFGGSNAHIVLEEAPAPAEDSLAAGQIANLPEIQQIGNLPHIDGACLLPLSARSEKALRDLARRYVAFLGDDPPPWRDVCYTAAVRRDHHDCRLAVLAQTPAEARELLESYLDGGAPGTPGRGRQPSVFSGRKPYGRGLKIAFVYDADPAPGENTESSGCRVPALYPGSAEMWKSYGAGLARTLPGFASSVERIDDIAERILGWRLSAVFKEDAVGSDRHHAPSALLALQLALTAWWRSAGVTPDVVVGPGTGELAAACAAGILTAEEALQVVAGHHVGHHVPMVVVDERGEGGPLPGPQPRAALLPFLSCVDGQAHSGLDLGGAHWQSCLRRPPNRDSAAKALSQRTVDFRLGLGARAAPAAEPLGETVGPSLATLGLLYAAGVDLTWGPLVPANARCVRLPAYPWQKQRLWAPQNPWTAPAPAVEKDEGGRMKDELIHPSSFRLHPSASRPDLIVPYVAPQSELEKSLAEAWSAVLGIEGIGIHDNFFELGGDSLQAAILLNQLSASLGRPISLPLRDMFEGRTIAKLAGRIEAALQSEAVGAQRPIVPVPRPASTAPGELALSLNQEALWFLDRLEPDRPTYMLHLALNVRGPLDIPALERALNEIARRHEVLRTTFPEVNGSPTQVIAPPGLRSLPVVDLGHFPASEREIELRRRISQEMGRPIDLEHGPLIRITLFKRAENDHAAVASTHHIIHDGWSMGILLRELAALYPALLAGRPSPLPELPVQYADFAAWQRNLLQGETLEKLRAYWRGQLADVPPLGLPTDSPRPAIRTTRGSSRPCRLSPATSAAVLEFCRGEGVTPFMTLLTAFEVLLARYAGQDDFAVGAPVANRSRPETETLIGYFVNVVALRADLSGDPSFREAVARLRVVALDAFERQEMTLDQVVDAVKPPRDPSRNPIFQVMFALQNIRLPSPPDLGLKITPLDDCPPPPSANFDLTLELFDVDSEFRGSLNFSTDLFHADTIDRMAEQFEVLVAAAVRQPDQSVSALPLLEEDKRREMVVRWNDTARPYDRSRLVHHLFEAQAERQPDAPAVALDDQRWTYRQLNERANQLARFLQGQGVGTETRVGICLERSPQLLMAVLGVLKAGGAYVPLDPAYTRDAEERLKYVLQDAQVSLVLTSSALAATIGSAGANLLVLDEGAWSREQAGYSRSEYPACSKPTAENLAYILYTSGSTGRPKGVMVTHRNLVNAYYGWLQAYRLDTDVRSHLQMASFGFDVFGGDMVRALCSGGKLVICPKETLLEPERLLRLIRREDVDIGEFVPVVMRHLVQYLEDTDLRLDSLRLAIVGSDAWYVAEHKRTLRCLGPNTRLINSYGLTETTIDSSYFEGDTNMLPDAALVPIGRPLANVRLYVLDNRMQPAPIGVPGELYIGGDGVSRGYVNAELNAARFLDDPFVPPPAGTRQPEDPVFMPGAGSPGWAPVYPREGKTRLCRTGDRARWRADGQVEFLGRADNQVKIRGFRVEPGEIEEVLGEHPALAQAAVAPRERTAGDLRLVAYVVGKAGMVPDVAEMKQFLAQRVPDYMVPSAFVTLPALPTTASGKVDRNSLPAPDWSSASLQSEFVAPRTETEQQLAAIWSEVLGLERVGAHDNFFDLGGNSLLALRLVSRVRAAFALDLPLVTLFTAPTVAGLAAVVEKMRSGAHAEADLSSEPVDWDAECELDPAIRPPMSGVPVYSRDGEPSSELQIPATEPSRILLTGATGFLGAYLLRELLEQTRADVYCLVRARSAEDGKKRIADNLRQYDLQVPAGTMYPWSGSAGRVIPVCGELAEPRLGLSPEDFDSLAATIDAVYHNGAYVNFVYPYQVLKPANVAGTVEVLRLATTTKIKPVHFVSTVSVFDSPEYGALGTIGEDQPLEVVGGLQGGYAQSKCVAEKLVRAAGQRGLPVTVYRPGRVTADSETGAESLADYTTLLLRLCIEMKMGPSSDDRVDMTPVDYVAQAIVGLGQRAESTGKTFHLVNPRAVPVRDVYRSIRACGYDLQEVSLDAWRTSAIRWGTQSKDQSFTAFSHWLMLMTPAALTAPTAGHPSTLGSATTPQPPTIDCEQTLSHLRPLGVSCPVVDVDRLKKQVQFLMRKKLVPPPSRPSIGKMQSLVPLRVGGLGLPLFCIHGLGGHVAAFLPLAQGVPDDRPVYGLQAQGLDPGQVPHDRIEEMAASYVKEIRDVQPQGPYLLAGWSMGGLIALEAAQQLLAAGQEVALVAMFDTYLSLKDFQEQDVDEQSVLHRIAPQLNVPIAELKDLPLERQWERIAELAENASGIGIDETRRLAAACKAHLRALSCYEPRPYAGPCVLFPSESGRSGRDRRWKAFCPNLCIEPAPGDHFSILRGPHVQVLAERLGRFLHECDGDKGMASRVGFSPPSSASLHESDGSDERTTRP